MREYSAARSRLSLIVSMLLAAVASAGLVASTSSDLQNLTAFYLSDIWLLPGLVAAGAALAGAAAWFFF